LDSKIIRDGATNSSARNVNGRPHMDHTAEINLRRPASRAAITFISLVAIAGFFLFSEHRLHALRFLPWILLLAACSLMDFLSMALTADLGGKATISASAGLSRRSSSPAIIDTTARKNYYA
jgi:hypothetical protein